MPEVIFRYSSGVAMADGVLIDATQGNFAAVSREHFPDRRLAMTKAVFALIEQSAESDDGTELAGIWHDILWMSRVCPVRPLPGGHTFKVGLRAGRALHWHELKITFYLNDHGEPCAAVMLPDED